MKNKYDLDQRLFLSSHIYDQNGEAYDSSFESKVRFLFFNDIKTFKAVGVRSYNGIETRDKLPITQEEKLDD